jgi:hypothetical protein
MTLTTLYLEHDPYSEIGSRRGPHKHRIYACRPARASASALRSPMLAILDDLLELVEVDDAIAVGIHTRDDALAVHEVKLDASR